MLKIISILTLLYFLSSTALPESVNNYDVHQGHNDNNQQPLPLQLADAASRSFYGAGGKQVKPCSRRKNNDPLDVADVELLPTPTYTARVVKPYQRDANNNFKPQSLKNIPNKDKVKENNENVSELYLYFDNHPHEAHNGDKGNVKTANRGKPVEALKDDNKVPSSEKKENFVLYENQKNKANSNEFAGSLYDDKNPKELFEADYNPRRTNTYSDESYYNVKNTKPHGKEQTGTYYKVDAYNSTPYKNKDYSNELTSESNEKRSRYSDETKGAFYGVKSNKSDSNELSDVLNKIKKHLAHSEELKNALKEFDETKTRPHSSNRYENKKQNVLSRKPEYKGFDQLSQTEDSEEDDYKCPSKQQNLAPGQDKANNATRRLLVNSDDPESKLLSSTSSENFVKKDAEQKVQKSKAKKNDDDTNNSEPAKEKEGEEYGSVVNNQYTSNGNTASPSHNFEARYGYDLGNPAQGPGISELSANGLNLMDHIRVCYACSSEYNPTCLIPNRHTTVKYCHLGHDKCVTKTYTNSNGSEVVIRDCADSCSGNSQSYPIWNSCDICKEDLCNIKQIQNGASAINTQSLVVTIFVIFAIKLT